MNTIITRKKGLAGLAKEAYRQNKRLVAPLVGFPGCDITGVSIKTAQQNYGLHYGCVEALAKLLKPDMAFMMMDLSVEANALGLPVRFPLHESSTVEKHLIRSVHEIKNFSSINILQDARIQSYIKTIELMSTGLPENILTAAYVIGPVSLVGLLEGAQQMALDSVMEPEKLHILCQFATDIIQKYACSLVQAGADAVCILEPMGSFLGPVQFKSFSADYVTRIINSYSYAQVETIYHICGPTMHLIESMANSGANALSLDSPEAGVDFEKAAKIVPENVVLVGNVNPAKVMAHGLVQDVEIAVKKILDQMKPYPNFILSTACDIPPQTPIENLTAFMKTARSYKP